MFRMRVWTMNMYEVTVTHNFSLHRNIPIWSTMWYIFSLCIWIYCLQASKENAKFTNKTKYWFFDKTACFYPTSGKHCIWILTFPIWKPIETIGTPHLNLTIILFTYTNTVYMVIFWSDLDGECLWLKRRTSFDYNRIPTKQWRTNHKIKKDSIRSIIGLQTIQCRTNYKIKKDSIRLFIGLQTIQCRTNHKIKKRQHKTDHRITNNTV